MKLSKIQNTFQDHITSSESYIDADFAALYKTGNIPLDERLRVYRDNIIGGLVDMLIQIYPTITALTGDQFSMQVFRTYVRKNLPKEGGLDTYGDDFYQYIQDLEPVRSLPYLPDIAQLDWAMSACEHAENDIALGPKDLKVLIEKADFTLDLRTSCHLISSPYPVQSLRAFALDPNNTTKSPPQMKNNPEHIMVYRPHLKAEVLTLDVAEYTLLAYLNAQKPLEESVELVISKYQDFDFNVFLQKFISLETFRKVSANR